ncbi:MAG: hypothetical protein HY810_10370 [Candidatus Omnitrophica bacterium]|nr:hypothetical protein [Candidatus Omnitrophota bacterium]
MQRKISLFILVLAVSLMLTGTTAYAGAKIQINDEASIDLGFMVNAQLQSTQADLDGDGKFDSQNNFGLRRARITLRGKVNEMAGLFYSTEIGSTTGGSGFDIRMLEAYIDLKFNKWLTVMAGEVYAPGSRQNLTSTGKLMCIDRPGLAAKSLTWGTTAKYGFYGSNYSDSVIGIDPPVASCDAGGLFTGSGELAEDFHLKYYFGIFDGIQVAGKDNFRIAGRVQFNIWDPEPGFWNASTYLGEKETISIGLGYDTQSAIAIDSVTGKSVDYSMLSCDLFTELFVGETDTFTAELGYQTLDLGDAGALQSKSASTGTLTALSTNSAKQASGSGMYLQTGYLFGTTWQPWLGFEQWESDAESGKGSYDAYRLGVTYYIKGHNANIKAGYEQFNSDAKIGTSQEDSVGTFVVGAQLFY